MVACVSLALCVSVCLCCSFDDGVGLEALRAGCGQAGLLDRRGRELHELSPWGT